MPRFVPRQRKHKVRQREAIQNGETNTSTNQIQILPLSKEAKEEKRRKLKEELRVGQSNISSKKQKRLDKYIENKLKKDENQDLLKSLSQAQIATSKLQSTKHLGKRKHAQFASDFGPRNDNAAHEHGHNDDSEDSDPESADSFDLQHAQDFSEQMNSGRHNLEQPSKSLVVQGSGLKQPLVVGTDGLPVISRRIKKARQKSDSKESWGGFDSDSADEENALPQESAERQYDQLEAGSGTDTDEDSAEDD